MSLLAEFHEKWGSQAYPPTQVSEADIAQAETELGVTFPGDYKNELLASGRPSPKLDLLSHITDNAIDMHDLSDLEAPEHIAENTRQSRAGGMPAQLIIIGTDCMGNLFCYDEADLKKGSRPSAPVYFWDHDFYETSLIAESFSVFIKQYLEI